MASHSRSIASKALSIDVVFKRSGTETKCYVGLEAGYFTFSLRRARS